MGTDIHGIFQRKTDTGWEDVQSNYNQERHYALFAWLGNVRNGFGFAGTPTHDRIEPLSDCRGFPEDFIVEDGEDHQISCNAMRGGRAKYYEQEDADPSDDSHLKMWMGDHSHSWLLDDEILNAKPPRILRTGIVTVEFFRGWDGESSPDSWCGGVSGPGVVVSSPSDVTEKTSHVQVEWFEDTSKSYAYFIDEVRRLKKEYGQVRFVFGFDS